MVQLVWRAVQILSIVCAVVCQDTCEDKFVYHDDKVEPYLYTLITEKDVYQKVFRGTDYSRKYKQYVSVYYINGTKENQEFILCTPEKSGRTRVKMLMQRLMDPNYNGTYQYLTEEYYTHIQELNNEDFTRITNDPNVPRFAFVRDPYTRTISMYKFFFGSPTKDFRLIDYRNHIRYIMGFTRDQPVRFDEFVKRLHNFNIKRPQHEKDRHLAAQTASCFLPQGMRYNYKLHLDEMQYWWPCFMRKVNVYDEAMHGWPEYDQCFLSTDRDPCNGPYLDQGVVKNDNSRKGHNTNSALMFDEYYSNKTIQHFVTQIYMEDFLNFGFKILL